MKPETKNRLTMLIIGIVMVALIVLYGTSQAYIQQIQLNQTISDAYGKGVADGQALAVSQIYQLGFVNLTISNQSVELYSKQGCFSQCQAWVQQAQQQGGGGA